MFAVRFISMIPNSILFSFWEKPFLVGKFVVFPNGAKQLIAILGLFVSRAVTNDKKQEA